MSSSAWAAGAGGGLTDVSTDDGSPPDDGAREGASSAMLSFLSAPTGVDYGAGFHSSNGALEPDIANPTQPPWRGRVPLGACATGDRQHLPVHRNVTASCHRASRLGLHRSDAMTPVRDRAWWSRVNGSRLASRPVNRLPAAGRALRDHHHRRCCPPSTAHVDHERGLAGDSVIRHHLDSLAVFYLWPAGHARADESRLGAERSPAEQAGDAVRDHGRQWRPALRQWLHAR